ncbi:DUF4251 domain-containing protein [uncultured Winogradskyella sp.]|uniref:DUF4251 domain-containing protein n=1 Tax=uncultured Winogradskyella sp. TaxID=395353 RepID=UPI002635173C|nr:DUF4251 domain-containing protein [uncultured Winogradskyella sp.]
MLLIIQSFVGILVIMVKKEIVKIFNVFIVLVVLTTMWSCKSSNVDDANKPSDAINTLQKLLEREEYYIDIDVVYPFNTAATQRVANALFLSQTGNNASRIDVTEDGHFIEINTDSVSGNLSFFGERRLSAGNYGGRNSGIVFNGIPEKYVKTINESKKRLDIEFEIKQINEPSETYNVKLELFPNNKVAVNITSTYKTFIKYSGRLRAKDESE